MTTKEEAMTPTERVRIEVISGEEEEVGPTIQTHFRLQLGCMLLKVKNNIGVWNLSLV